MSADFDEIMKRIQQMEEKEVRERLAKYEIALMQVDPITKSIIDTMFQPYRFILRNFRPIFGVLLAVRFEPSEFLVAREEDIENYTKKTVTHEVKWTTIKASSVVHFEAIHSSEERPREERPLY